jgi:PAS domain S-box-containing protein
MLAHPDPQALVDYADDAVLMDNDWRTVLDAVEAPVYVTDGEGAVTYWNRACVEFAGREPRLGEDRWCVTWKIYTPAGDFVPHDECPMAQAIRSRTVVRDTVAIALRPDGRRVAFRPYPTPLFDKDGEFKGAINLLLDVTDEQIESLRAQAVRCRRIRDSMYDNRTREMLDAMATGFERSAEELAPSA